MLLNMLHKIQADARGAALVYTLLVTAGLMVAAVAIISVTGIDSRLVLAQEDRKIVQYVAESAVEIIRQNLLRQEQITPGEMSPWLDFSLDDTQCRYQYQIKQLPDQQDQYVLTVKTQVTLDLGKTAEKDLELVIRYTPPGEPGEGSNNGGGPGDRSGEDSDPGIPAGPGQVNSAVYDYALVTGGNLDLTSGNPVIMGSVFSNSSIKLKSGVVSAGTVSAVGAIDVIDLDFSDSPAPVVTIAPNQARPLTMPVVNWDYLSKESDTYKISVGPTYEVKSESEIATSVVGMFVYAYGNIQITAAIPGSSIIAAPGDIYIRGDSQLEMLNVGLIAGHDIYIEGPPPVIDPKTGEVIEQNSGPQIHGFMMAGNNIITSGSATIWGSVVAGNQFIPGTDRHVIFHNRDAVEAIFNVKSRNSPRTNIISNYYSLNISNPVTPVENSADHGTDNPTVPPASHSGPDDTTGTPPEITIIQWKELN